MSIENIPSLSAREYTELLNQLGKDLLPRNNILLLGKHALGKSEITQQFFREHPDFKDYPFFELFLSQMADPGDLTGIPFREGDKMVFSNPWWRITDRPIILFADEVLRARPELIQPFFPLLTTKEVAGIKLHPDSIVIGASNAGDNYIQTDADDAFGSRWMPFNFNPTADEWIQDYALPKDLDARVIRYIRDKGERSLDGERNDEMEFYERTPDRRAWKKVSDYIKKLDKKIAIDDKVVRFIAGNIGIAEASEFGRFCRAMQGLTPKMMIESDEFSDLVPELQVMTLQQHADLVNAWHDHFAKHERMYADSSKVGERDYAINIYKTYLEWMEQNEMTEATGLATEALMDKDRNQKFKYILKASSSLFTFLNEFIDRR